MKKHITRHRTKNRLFRKPLLVLQVGTLHNTGTNFEDTPPSSMNMNYYVWRDATVEDIAITLNKEKVNTND